MGRTLFLLLLLYFGHASESLAHDHNRNPDNPVSPVRDIKPTPDRDRGGREAAPVIADEVRTFNGTGNNLASPLEGAALIPLARMTSADYADGIASLAGEGRPSARVISNTVFAQEEAEVNSYGATDFLWQWGQFLDHDIDLTDGADPEEPAPISVPVDDLHFYPGSTISLNRSVYDPETGITTPREQLNEITAWIDASNVYGSDAERATALREEGTAYLKTSAGNLLPFNVDGLHNAGGDAPTLFLAGDVRANEQVGLVAMHTLFVREHNRLVDEIEADNPDMSVEAVFQKARQIVGAQMQVITYREFLPALLGPRALDRYRGYQPEVDASIANEFSTAAYRFGHSALSANLLRLNPDGSEFADGPLALRDAFFRPDLLQVEGQMEAIFRGFAAQGCQQVDAQVIDDVRNFLFGAPPSAGFDLAALNIQRGRDHGLGSYNDVREELGLDRATSFADISGNQDVVDRLATAYLSVDDVDLWVGGLAEDHLEDSHLGETFSIIITRQFEALRDGDRFWYTRTLTQDERRDVERTRLSDIIRRNTNIGDELPRNVFSLNQEERDDLSGRNRTAEERPEERDGQRPPAGPEGRGGRG